jgi:hypothetical protein
LRKTSFFPWISGACLDLTNFIWTFWLFYNHKSEEQEVAALSCRNFPHPHTAFLIKEFFKNLFKDYGLDARKFIQFTTEKGSNIYCQAIGIASVQSCSTEAYASISHLLEKGAAINVNDADSCLKIELDIQLEDDRDEPDHSEYEFNVKTDDELGGLDANAIEREYNEFLENEKYYRQAFWKHLYCMVYTPKIKFGEDKERCF